MGCDYYEFDGGTIRFDESNDEDCLCTFPYNDQGKLDAARVRALAYLGAAVALIQSELRLRNEYFTYTIYLPASLPDWIVSEIRRLLPDREGDELGAELTEQTDEEGS